MDLKDFCKIDVTIYHSFCLNLLNILFQKLNYQICYLNKKHFNNDLVKSIGKISSIDIDKSIMENCSFIVKNNNKHLIFSFEDQDKSKLQKLSNNIISIDKDKYQSVHIIVFKNSDNLDNARKIKNTGLYKRCFFTSFDQICLKTKEIDKESYLKVFSLKWECGDNSYHNKKSTVNSNKNIVDLHNITVISNQKVGDKNSRLFKLTFKTDDCIDILPGQFIMIDTLKERQKELLQSSTSKVHNSISALNPNQHDLENQKISYLKRPFGIYRTYYENFSGDYLSKLNIDKALTAILYTVKPNKFEILYKVLENGIGTKELTKLVKEDKVEMLAPLGKRFDLRDIIKEELDEIHIIGGGVGIAPLIYIAQALRFYNCKIKAFIGIENYSSLIYNPIDINPSSFTEPGKNAKIYVDDLKMLGLSEKTDIYVSLLSKDDKEQIKDIDKVYRGCTIIEPYAQYLERSGNKRIAAFTCGPIPMMKKVHELTTEYNIESYVLMEKRMGCGIGVCFSCVCKTKVNDENHYSRVCIEGPVFESKKIDWNE